MSMNKGNVVLTITRQDSNFPLIVKTNNNGTSKRRNLRRNGKLPLLKNRIMNKRGRINIYLNKIPDKSIRYVRDLWHTLVNMRWRWIMLIVGLVNVSAYLIFAIFFWYDAWLSGDFADTKNHKTCIKGTSNFASFFMLGIETITTTGYGYFHPTEYCKLVFVILTCSTIVTIFIDGAFISVVYAKFTRPTVNWNIFSKKAVITLRNGKLCFIIRINDLNGQHLIDTKIHLFFVKDCISKEGECIPNLIREMQITSFGMLFVPVDIVHEITPHSPLWKVSAQDLITNRFEILAVVTGNCLKTGQPSQSQTSYLSKEILWGQRFTPCIEYDSNKGEFVINRKHFNNTVIHDTPLCCAKELNAFQNEFKKRRASFDMANILSDFDSTADLT